MRVIHNPSSGCLTLYDAHPVLSLSVPQLHPHSEEEPTNPLEGEGITERGWVEAVGGVRR